MVVGTMDATLDTRTRACLHTFHIPVMGVGFTLDTALRVAPLGISSVISLVDDQLIESAREMMCAAWNLDYQAIDGFDARARRITAYLDLVHDQVQVQTAELSANDFGDPRGPSRYFSLLPTLHPLRRLHADMLDEYDPDRREQMMIQLRRALRPGSIDVNIMTKVDREHDAHGQPRPAGHSDAVAALRGFAASKLDGAVVFSAGFNPRLFNHIALCPDFMPTQAAAPRKRVILKVSDFRSASIQSKYLAKRGIWVSEFRVESGLNCGGHAFPSTIALLGPTLDSFAQQRRALADELHKLYVPALTQLGLHAPAGAPQQLVTVQGGVGTAAEHEFLLAHYGVDAVGWGSPFLLVPEVCRIDEKTLHQLRDAQAEQLRLSRASPLGVRFWRLDNCASAAAHEQRRRSGRPGSRCPKGLLARKTPLAGVPLCPASRAYQRRALAAIDATTSAESRRIRESEILAPECICHDLGASFRLAYGIAPLDDACVCPGPNLAHFRKITDLDTMVDHIYGRADLLAQVHRPHMLLNELQLYIEYFTEQIQLGSGETKDLAPAMLERLAHAVRSAISNYRQLGELLGEGSLGKLDELESRFTAVYEGDALSSPCVDLPSRPTLVSISP